MLKCLTNGPDATPGARKEVVKRLKNTGANKLERPPRPRRFRYVFETSKACISIYVSRMLMYDDFYK
jgi:hypothetical protein